MKVFSALMGLAIIISPLEFAQAQSSDTPLNDIIGNLEQVYKTDKVRKAKTIRLEEERRMEYESHDYGPDFHDLTTQKRHYTLDIKNEKGVGEFLTHMGTNVYHGREIVDQGKSIFVDYLTGMYQPQDDVEFMTNFGGTFRSSDVLMALYITNNPDKSTYDGTAMWLGRNYHKLKTEFPNSPPLTIYVENGTGHIGKMERTLDEETVVSYTFDNHKKQNGITLASDQSVYVNREPLFFSFNRNIALNDRTDRNAFTPIKGIVQEPERTNQEEMTVDSVSDNSYHVGQGGAYTVFINSPSGLIALGTQAGFADRLAAYRKESGDLSRLAYAMVADHHQTAMAGAADAAAEGATLLITADSRAKIDTQFADAANKAKVEVVDTKRSIAGVNIVSLPTSHASQVLVAYDDDNEFLYQLLHYASPYKDVGFVSTYSAVTLYEALKPYDVGPRVLLSAASRKPEAWGDFVSAVESHNPTRCFHDRPICR